MDYIKNNFKDSKLSGIFLCPSPKAKHVKAKSGLGGFESLPFFGGRGGIKEKKVQLPAT